MAVIVPVAVMLIVPVIAGVTVVPVTAVGEPVPGVTAGWVAGGRVGSIIGGRVDMGVGVGTLERITADCLDFWNQSSYNLLFCCSIWF